MNAQPTPAPSPTDLDAFWMPFTANRQFKAHPRLLARAKGMYYWTEDGREVLDGVAGFWQSRSRGGPPAWASLTDNAVAPFAASCGVCAVAQVLSAARAAGTDDTPALPHVGEADDYYAAALVLLARVAWYEYRTAAASV